MATTFQLSVTGKVTGKNNIAIPGVTVKALWNGSTIQPENVLGSAKADAWGRFKLTYRYQAEKDMASLTDGVPVCLQVEAGEKQIVVGKMDFVQTTLNATQDVVLKYMHYTNVLSKAQLAIARSLTAKSRENFKKLALSPEEKSVVVYVQKNLACLKIQDGSCNDETYDALKSVIFHTKLVFNKKKIAKLYEMMQKLGYGVPPEMVAMNFVNAETLKPINALREKHQIKKSNLIDRDAWTLLEEDFLAKRWQGSGMAEIQMKINRAAKYILKDENVDDLPSVSRLRKLKKNMSSDEFQSKIKDVAEKNKNLIGKLQEKLGLTVSGVLDLSTFERVESVASSHGSGISYLKAPDARKLVVPKRNMSLNVHDEEQVPILQNGLAYLGYKIDMREVNNSTFGKTTMAAVKAFQVAQGLPVTTKFDTATRKAFAAPLLTANPKAQQIKTTHVIKGSIRDEKWDGMEGKVVEVYLQNNDGSEKKLCTNKSNKKGFFNIPLSVFGEENGGKIPKAFNIKVNVCDFSRPDEIIVSKHVQVKSEKTFVNFTGALRDDGTVKFNGHYRGVAEFSNVEKLLKKALKDKYDSFLNQCYVTVSNIAAQVGLQDEKVLMFVLAHRMSMQTSELRDRAQSLTENVDGLNPLSPEVFYGLLRQNVFGLVNEDLFADECCWVGKKADGLKTNVSAPVRASVEIDKLFEVLCTTSEVILKKAINGALENTIVSQNVKLSKDVIIAGLVFLKQCYVVLMKKLENIGYTFYSLLQIFENEQVLNRNQFLQIGSFFIQSSCKFDDNFFQKVKEKLGKSESDVARMKNLFLLSSIIRNNLGLLEKTYHKVGFHFIGQIVKYSQNEWKKLGATDGEIQNIEIRLSIELPKEYFIWNLNENSLLLKTSENVRNAVSVLCECMFEDDADKRFDLYDVVSPDEYVYTASNGKVFERNAIRTVQRVRRISSNYYVAAALLKSELTNASIIYLRGENALLDVFSSMNVPNAESAAKETFKRVEFIYSQVVACYLNLRDSANKTVKEGKDSPELRNLFGTLDCYAVNDDMTLLGAPAYLTDLLRFLGQMPAKNGKTALDVLFNRRSDIGDIKLNSSNANDLIPYIDLVCYTLEGYVREKCKLSLDKKKYDNVAELRIAVSDVVYSMLENSSMPRLKPYFSLPQAKNRAYFSFLEVPRYRIMELFGADIVEVAGEYLGMSLKERKDAFVGYYKGNSKTPLAAQYGECGMQVTDLMKKLDMTYPELTELMDFFDFTFIQSSVSDYADITLQFVTNKRSSGNNRTYEEALLLRRLQRMSGLSLKEFLKIVKHPLIGNDEYMQGSKTENLLKGIYSFLRVKEILSLSFEESLELFGGEYLNGEEKEVNKVVLARYVSNYVFYSGENVKFASSVYKLLQKVKRVENSEFSTKDLEYLTSGDSYSLLAEETLENYADQVKSILEKSNENSLIDLENLLSSWLGLGNDKICLLTENEKIMDGLSKNPNLWCRHLHRLAICDQRLMLNGSQFQVLAKYADTLKTPDFFNPEFSSWTVDQLLAMSKLVSIDYQFQPEDGGACYMETLCSVDQPEKLLERLSALSGLNMTGYMSDEKIDYFRSPSCYDSIIEAMDCMIKLRCSGQELTQWGNPGNKDAEEKLAAILRENISARYSVAKAGEWLRQIENPIREEKRDVLVAYVLEYDASFSNTSEMTAYFLMDVEMNADQDTSEIRHALSSIQMFVQRCLLNVESDVVVSKESRKDVSSYDSWSQWNWMKNYRVWEANRKIFLFPENYLEPELRDGMSPFFQEFLNELQQNEATQENMEEALLNYLHKLDEVAHLDVCGIYRQQDDLDEAKSGYELDVWHVIARTKSSPRVYYYRTYDVNYKQWSPWEKIEVDLDGEHIVPVVYNRRLYVFWLQFVQKEMKPKKLPAAEATSGTTEIQETLKYYEIQLLWTERRGKSWQAKRMSKQKLMHPWNRPTQSYTLKPTLKKDTNDLFLDIYLSTSKEFNSNNQKLNYDLYLDDKRAFQTRTPYCEAFSPWHSAAFVFNGDVKKVLFKDVSGSYDCVQRYFGSDGIAMMPLENAGSRLFLPQGMHLEGNWLKNNIFFAANSSKLNVPAYTELTQISRTETLANGLKSPFGCLLSLQNQEISAARTNALMFYQDNERVFSVLTKDVASEASGNGSGVYSFESFYHPFVDNFIQQLNKDGLDGFFKRELQEKPWDYSPLNYNAEFFKKYKPTSCVADYPVESVDFSNGGAYSVYNWELFFHIPFTIACRLMQNQKFEDAMNWFHYVFNPIDYVKNAGACPECYWVTLPFRENAREQVSIEKGKDDEYRIEGILESIGKHSDQVKAWRNNPFKPHIVAQYRTAAYQHQVVLKYINNLISWGDTLFREDTMESLNEATMLYMLAGEILGLRPNKVVNPLSGADDKSFNDLQNGLDVFGNAKAGANLPIYIENNVSVDDGTLLDSKSKSEMQKLDISYFSTPSNDELLSCWDVVADRLFKMRNSMNIDGVYRKLALYEPPIDPAMLVRAAAAGISIKDAVSSANDCRVYKFRPMVQKAIEFCQDVKALGEKLLAALEKKDAEALSQLRQSQELLVLNSTTAMKKQQIEEAKVVVEQLNASMDGAVIRKNFYENIEYMSDKEVEALQLVTSSARLETEASIIKNSASLMTVLPSISAGINGFGGSPQFSMRVFDGGMLASAMNFIAQDKEIQAALKNRRANVLTTKSGYERREAEWKLQAQTAAKEVQSLERQIAGAEIRLALAELDLENHQLQIENNKAMTEAMNNRFATEKLYNWMANQVISVYKTSYGMAYDLALKAQKCYAFELGVDNPFIIKDSHWDSLYKGLMAGDTLLINIRELEKKYMEENTRSLELTKSISLADLNPGALMDLVSTGNCTFEIPDKVFNMDYPSHYLRRIKNVSISIPCIAGPHTSINCSLTLNKSHYFDKKDKEIQGGGGSSIATSSALNDCGLFEVNFNDERYLPFEGMGAASEWTISLPKETNYFDRTSIADVILNISYTARVGEENVKDNNESVPYGRLLNLKSEFPDEWYCFTHPSKENSRFFVFRAEVGSDRLARYLRGVSLKVISVWSKDGESVKEIFDVEASYKQQVLEVKFEGLNPPAYDNLYVVLGQNLN